MRIALAGRRVTPRNSMLALACLLALPAAARASTTVHGGAVTKPSASATLEGCVPSAVQSERSATFVGEMSAIPGSTRMLMRIEVLERSPGDPTFHAVSYPGLGLWLHAAPGVHTYKNFNKVTDLSAPALYRAAIHFRWLSAKGRLLKTLELRTGRCDQPAAPAGNAAGSAPAAGG
jgi:hypothetical protein